MSAEQSFVSIVSGSHRHTSENPFLCSGCIAAWEARRLRAALGQTERSTLAARLRARLGK